MISGVNRNQQESHCQSFAEQPRRFGAIIDETTLRNVVGFTIVPASLAPALSPQLDLPSALAPVDCVLRVAS